MPAESRLRAASVGLASVAVTLAFAVVALVTPSGAEAAPQDPQCGDVITTDTTLDKDLVNCPNNGILIGADNVTLDLNGHTIDGDGTPAAGCDPDQEFCDVGVLNRGHDGVTVTRGSVRQFEVGVWSLNASHNSLLGISSSSNDGSGLGFFRGTRSLVRNCSGSGSIRRDGGQGMFLIGSHRVRVLDSSFRDNGDVGIFIGLRGVESSHNLIRANRVSRNEGAGIVMEKSHRNQLRGNRVIRNDAGILLGPGSRNEITQNRVIRGRDGIRIEKGRGNLVADNFVSYTSRAGIRLGISHPSLGGARNLVRRNVVRGSGGDGFVVAKKDDHSLLKRNVAKGAHDDGFDVRSRTARLSRNRAIINHDLGIAAVRGVIDGGGNVARGNGDPRQCVHIACR